MKDYIKKKTGLFFGSFNPIHIGHLVIANYIIEFTALHELWFVVSPQNPLKKKKSLLAEYHRLELVRRAIETFPRMKASNIEFKMPKPSYTIDTLIYLEERYPAKEFVLIIGSDNIRNLHKWKNFELLLSNYKFLVYPRPHYELSRIELQEEITVYKSSFQMIDAPMMEISSAMIRNAVMAGKDIRFFLSDTVYQYLTEMNFYK